MSLIDKALAANRNYAKNYDPTLGKRPTPKIAVVTCMDPRLSDLPGILGLPQGDLDVIRTGGPAVTEDVLGELVVSTRVLGTTEILLLNHTGCGFTTFTDEELNAKLSASTGDASPAPMRFFSYKDPDDNTREQIKKVTSHPWIAKDVPVRGFVFDVETGLLREVQSNRTPGCRLKESWLARFKVSFSPLLIVLAGGLEPESRKKNSRSLHYAALRSGRHFCFGYRDPNLQQRCHPDRSVPGFPATLHWAGPRVRLSLRERRMKCTNATKFHRKSGGA